MDFGRLSFEKLCLFLAFGFKSGNENSSITSAKSNVVGAKSSAVSAKISAASQKSNVAAEKSNVGAVKSNAVPEKMKVEVCSGHKKPCSTKTVNKEGENKGRVFYTCSLTRYGLEKENC